MTTDKLTIPADTQSYRLWQPPKVVGYWCLYGNNPQTMFSMYEKPTDEQIANTEKLLGWKWKDAK